MKCVDPTYFRGGRGITVRKTFMFAGRDEGILNIFPRGWGLGPALMKSY